MDQLREEGRRGLDAAIASFNDSGCGMAISLREWVKDPVLVFSGDLDGDCVPALDRFLSALLALLPRPGAFTIDMGALEYASSTGIGALIVILSECMKTGVTLTLGDINPGVRSVMEVLGVLPYFAPSGSKR